LLASRHRTRALLDSFIGDRLDSRRWTGMGEGVWLMGSPSRPTACRRHVPFWPRGRRMDKTKGQECHVFLLPLSRPSLQSGSRGTVEAVVSALALGFLDLEPSVTAVTSLPDGRVSHPCSIIVDGDSAWTRSSRQTVAFQARSCPLGEIDRNTDNGTNGISGTVGIDRPNASVSRPKSQIMRLP